ncbi:MAG: COQ9 family protein [Rickettsiales bacterium]
MTVTTDGEEALFAYVRFAGERGWGEDVLNHAAANLGTTEFDVRRAIGHTPELRQRFFFRWLQEEMARRVGRISDFDRLPVREKIRAAVLEWINAAESCKGGKKAVRRVVVAHMARGRIASATLRQWGIADAVWRLCGDRATDFNHYSKRAILSAVLAATIIYWLNDASLEHANTNRFLDKRIADALVVGGALGRALARLAQKR